MAKARMFGIISKVEDLGDGTRMVTGIASTPTKDSDGESFTGDCLRGAIPDYMAKRRAVREMHQPIAAGVTTEMYVDDDDVTHITAHVVDPVTVLKVDTGVLKMFSIQGNVPPGGRDATNRKIIHKLNLREVSLVDVGANPDCDVTEVVKLDGDEPDEEEAQVAEIETAEQTAKADAAEVAAAKIAVVPTGDPVKKGLYGVASFASVLQSIGYIAQDTQYEADYEGDSSPIPANLREWLKAGAAILQAMTEEETAELITSLTPAAPVEVVALADTGATDKDGVAKAGAKHSAATKAALKSIADALTTAQESMKAFEEPSEEAETPAAKIETPAPDADTVTKMAGLEDSVSKISAERDALKDTVAKLQGEASQHQAALDEIVKSMKAKGYLLTAEKSAETTVAKADSPEAVSTDPLTVMKQTIGASPTIHPRA